MKILLFARFKEVLGTNNIDMKLTRSSTIKKLRQDLFEQYPRIGSLLEKSLFAINGEYASDNTFICDADEVALLPPVSGG